MTETTRLTVNAWTSPDEREQKVISMLQELSGVRLGKEFLYRGLTLTKVNDNERARREPALEVHDPDGEYVGKFQPAEMDSYEIVEMLDDARAEWTGVGQPAL